MSKREALCIVVGFQLATLIIFLACKFKVGVFNPDFHQHNQEVAHG